MHTNFFCPPQAILGEGPPHPHPGLGITMRTRNIPETVVKSETVGCLDFRRRSLVIIRTIHPSTLTLSPSLFWPLYHFVPGAFILEWIADTLGTPRRAAFPDLKREISHALVVLDLDHQCPRAIAKLGEFAGRKKLLVHLIGPIDPLMRYHLHPVALSYSQ